MRWYRQPAAHFVALGLALFVGKRVLTPEARPALVITQGRVNQLRADFQRETGRPPTPSDEQALVARAIDDELLYQEGRARGMDGNDPSIKYRLTEKMRFVTDAADDEERTIDEDLYRQAVALGFDANDPIVRRIIIQKTRLLLSHQADERPITEADLRDYYDRHRERYAQATRVSLWQVFLAAGPEAAGREREAAALLARVRTESIPPASAVRLGDPFPLGAHLEAKSAHELGKVFGAEFAQRVLALEAGGWQGPVPSSQGLHLVWVEARQAERIAAFEAVRSRVLAECRAERRQAQLAAALRALREKYVVRVDRAAGVREG